MLTGVFFVRSVGKVQPGHVHAQAHEVAQHRFGVARRTDRADDLSPAIRAAHVGSGCRWIHLGAAESLRRLA